jgi:hypothetical protein
MITTTTTSNAAGIQGALLSEQLGLNPPPMQASLGTCSGCSDKKPLISCGNCSCLTCRKCCAECNSRGDNKA